MRKNIFKFTYLALIFIVIIHLLLLKRLVFFPYPELFVYSYLTGQGLVPYKQILDQHFPGLMFFPINLNTLGMLTPQIARFWHLGVIVLTQVSLFVVAKKIFKSEKWALVTNLLYLVWQPFFEGYVLWIDLFIPLLLLPSFYLGYSWLESKKNSHLFPLGFFLGLALLFKQTAAPLVVLVILLVLFWTKKLKSVFLLALGLLIPTFVLIYYIIGLEAWNDFYYWTITFNLTTFAQMGRKYPDLVGLIKSSVIYGLAGGSWLYLIIKSKSRGLFWLGAFFLGSLVFAYARFDFVHLQPALPFAILIIISTTIRLPRRIRLLFIGFLFIAAIYFVPPFYKANMSTKILFFGELERRVSEKVSEFAEPGESVFAFATMPHLYQMTNTLPPGKVFVFQFPWFMLEAEEIVLSGIIRDPPRVVVRDKEATTGGENLISHMQKIQSFIDEKYKVVDIIEGTEILTRK